MARKPNWKARGLPGTQTDADRLRIRKAQQLDRRMQTLPSEIRQLVDEDPVARQVVRDHLAGEL